MLFYQKETIFVASRNNVVVLLQGRKAMAESIQVKLPPEMATLFDDLKEVRAKDFEPTTNLSIIIDAVKAFHKAKVVK